jgi:hypothetical protein
MESDVLIQRLSLVLIICGRVPEETELILGCCAAEIGFGFTDAPLSAGQPSSAFANQPKRASRHSH